MIRKVGKKYVVFSESGKRLSKPLSHGAAVKRLAEIEFFKAKGKGKR